MLFGAALCGLFTITNSAFAQSPAFITSTYAVGSGPDAVAVADINGDGNVDLICANGGDGILSVLTNNGVGGFVNAGTCAAGPDPTSVLTVDVNGNGKVDLIVGNKVYDNGTFLVLTNDGSGGFGNARTNGPTYGPISAEGIPGIAAADFNGDSKVDIVCTWWGNFFGSLNTGFVVLTNDGSSDFVPASIVPFGLGPSEPISVAVADVNGDGKTDIINTCFQAAPVEVWTNSGNMGFANAGNYSMFQSPGIIMTSDVNGDGSVDLVVADRSRYSNLVVFTNNGTGHFHGFVFNLSSPQSVAASDINGDGKVDLITGSYYPTNALTVSTNDGSGRFAIAGIYPVGNTPISVAAADVNGDGHMDLICANSSDNTLMVLTQLPTLVVMKSGNDVVVSWKSSWSGWTLQQNSDLTTINWSASSGVVDDGINKSLTITSPTGSRFFRLSRP